MPALPSELLCCFSRLHVEPLARGLPTITRRAEVSRARLSLVDFKGTERKGRVRILFHVIGRVAASRGVSFDDGHPMFAEVARLFICHGFSLSEFRYLASVIF